MYAKVISFGLIALLAAATSVTQWLQFGSTKDYAPRLLSVPITAGEWHRTDAWGMPHGAGSFQENLGYQQKGMALTISIDHDFKHAHNAINCFLGHGELLDTSWVGALKTRDGSAYFNFARLKTETSISVVAATQCRADACIENPSATKWADLGRAYFWKSLFVQPSNALALNISITRPSAWPDIKIYAEMEEALARFVENLDLTPLRESVAQQDASLH